MTKFERTEEQAHLDTAALRLRSLGFSYQAIADQMGVTKATAYNRCQRALAAIPAEAVDEFRASKVSASTCYWRKRWRRLSRKRRAHSSP